MSTERIAVGVIGLGTMGMGAACSLLRAGVDTWGCDNRAERLREFTAAGGRTAPTPLDLAQQVSVLITLVVNAAQTEEVLFGRQGAVAGLRKGSLVIASATTPPAFAEALGARLTDAGMLALDAPVSGGGAKAAQGAMTVMASGSEQAFTAAAPVLEAIASKTYRLGDRPGIGSTFKMINQHLAGVHIAAACEAMALGIRSGCDPQRLYEVICDCAGASWMFQNRVPHILAGDYRPLSAVDIFVKDMGIVQDQARAIGAPLPLAATALQMYLQAHAAGFGHDDDASLVKLFPGVDLPKPQAAP